MFQILHMHIGQVEKQALTTAGSPLLVRCKNFMCVTFVIPRERDCQDIYLSLQEFSRPSEWFLPEQALFEVSGLFWGGFA